MKCKHLRVILVVAFLSGALALSQDNSTQSAAAGAASKAAVPRLVRFSGVVQDIAGKPTHGVQDVTFSLYREEAGGEPLWFETQTVEADALGRYSVLLGAMHPEGLPMDLFTSGEARWLGVSVGRLPEQARVLLVAVPYALKAADADTLGGKPATAFVASDQLKEQVQSEVKAQVTESGSTTRTLVGTSPTPQVIAETSPATFTCATSGVCVQSTQSGAGGIALRGAVGSATGIAGIFDNLGGGKILSGRTTSYAEKFYVDGSGNLWAGGSLTANSFSGTSGAAVFGAATAGSGTAYGVRGQSASPSGVGAFGYATSPTGLTYGLLGSNLSASGTGLSGSASSPTGVTIGVRAVVQSPNGTAAIFDNLGGGKILSGRTTGYAEKFSVAGNGDVTSLGTFTGNGSGLSNVTASNLSCVACVGASQIGFITNSVIAPVLKVVQQSNSMLVSSGDPTTALLGDATGASAYASGLYGRSASIHGAGLVAENTGGGQILSGLASGVEKFSVSNDGTVTASGTLEGTRLALLNNSTTHVSVGGINEVRLAVSMGAGLVGTRSVVWATPFADANYTITCTAQDTSINDVALRVHHIQSVTASGFTVVVLNDDLSFTHSGKVLCLAIHD